MKKLFYIVGCLLVLSSSPILAVVEDPSVVLVRTYERGLKPEITIVRETGKPEVIKVRFQDYLTTYRKVIADLYAQGYVIQSSTSLGDGGIHYDTLIFAKIAKP
jgi:peptide methionine sulfoxide reductase MsrA